MTRARLPKLPAAKLPSPLLIGALAFPFLLLGALIPLALAWVLGTWADARAARRLP